MAKVLQKIVQTTNNINSYNIWCMLVNCR